MSFLLVFRLGRSTQLLGGDKKQSIDRSLPRHSTACAHMVFGDDLKRVEHRMHWPKVPPSTEEKEEEVWMSTTCSPVMICRWVVVFPCGQELFEEDVVTEGLDGFYRRVKLMSYFGPEPVLVYTMRLSASWAASWQWCLCGSGGRSSGP